MKLLIHFGELLCLQSSSGSGRRGDSGFACDMSWCKANGVDYLFGLARNCRLEAEAQIELEQWPAEALRPRWPGRSFHQGGWRLGAGGWDRIRSGGMEAVFARLPASSLRIPDS